MRSNPDHIYETDDDNYPLANWDDIFNKVDQDIPLISSSDTAFNVSYTPLKNLATWTPTSTYF